MQLNVWQATVQPKYSLVACSSERRANWWHFSFLMTAVSFVWDLYRVVILSVAGLINWKIKFCDNRWHQNLWIIQIVCHLITNRHQKRYQVISPKQAPHYLLDLKMQNVYETFIDTLTIANAWFYFSRLYVRAEAVAACHRTRGLHQKVVSETSFSYLYKRKWHTNVKCCLWIWYTVLVTLKTSTVIWEPTALVTGPNVIYFIELSHN